MDWIRRDRIRKSEKDRAPTRYVYTIVESSLLALYLYHLPLLVALVYAYITSSYAEALTALLPTAGMPLGADLSGALAEPLAVPFC